MEFKKLRLNPLDKYSYIVYDIYREESNMQAIYEPKGRAREYHELACNLYRGCGHGCGYCYAPAATKMDRREFYDNPIPRVGILDALEKDATRMEFLGDKRHVMLCFSCDPYQPIEKGMGITRQAIAILKRHQCNVSILTKGGVWAYRDFDLLTPEDKFGATLTFMSDADSLKWEPKAALPLSRFESLWMAHRLGIKTWISLEPVIDPAQTLEIISETMCYADIYKVGTLNYVHNTIDWSAFAHAVKARLEELGKDYYLKEDLRKWLK